MLHKPFSAPMIHLKCPRRQTCVHGGTCIYAMSFREIESRDHMIPEGVIFEAKAKIGSMNYSGELYASNVVCGMYELL